MIHAAVGRLRSRGRRRLGGLATIAVALGTAGCSNFVSPPVISQQGGIGPIAVSTYICLDGFAGNNASGNGYGNDCGTTPAPLATYTDTSGTTTSVDTSASQGQVMIGYLVPTGVTVPTALTSPDLPGVTFTRSDQYATALATASGPAPSGYQWIGYLSSEFTVSHAVGIHLTATFAPPAGSGGKPFSVQQVVLGDRADGNFNGQVWSPTRPINCNETQTDGAGHSMAPTGCVNDHLATPLTVTPRELTVSAPSAPIDARAGHTAVVPFTVRYAGMTPASTFTLSATGGARGVRPSPTTPTLTTTAAGTTIEKVAVTLPGTLRAGTYRVLLNVRSATPGCGAAALCTRSATATLRVSGLRPVLRSIRLIHSRLRLRFRLNVASSVRLVLERRAGRGWSKVHQLKVRGHAGVNDELLRRRFGRWLAPAGRYRLLIDARNHTLGSAPHSVVFVVR